MLLPMACLACDRLIESGTQRLGLCARCRGRLRPLGSDRCPGCGRPLRGFDLPAGYRCGSCRRLPPAFDRLIARWSYRPPLDSVIQALKFQRLEALGRHLAHEMAAELVARPIRSDFVVWIPLHWRRLLARGYNQAERIARPLARELELPAVRALARTRATPAQTGLDRERRAVNLKGAFRVRRPERVAGASVLLVDDVTTTGATLDAAARALRRAGTLEIVAVAAARTPGIDEPSARKLVIW